jgi:hypothetical protein
VAGLGLFASQLYAAGDVVTAYGGGLRTARFVRSLGKDALTHARRIPDSDFVRDGRPWAAFFDYSELDAAAERNLDAARRTRVLPVDVDLKRVALGERAALSSFSWSCGADEGVFPDMLKRSGLGYLSNTSAKPAQNVRIVDVCPRKDGLGTHWMFLVATRSIAAHDEPLQQLAVAGPLFASTCHVPTFGQPACSFRVSTAFTLDAFVRWPIPP